MYHGNTLRSSRKSRVPLLRLCFFDLGTVLEAILEAILEVRPVGNPAVLHEHRLAERF
jgi:hypothetical protein